jgi:hypothetical protein
VVRIVKNALAPVSGDEGIYIHCGDLTEPMPASGLVNRVWQAAEQVDEAPLAEAIAKRASLIELLGEQLRATNILKSKAKDNVIGGLIGAAMGAMPALLMWQTSNLHAILAVNARSRPNAPSRHRYNSQIDKPIPSNALGERCEPARWPVGLPPFTWA